MATYNISKRSKIEALLQDLEYKDLQYIQGVLDVLLEKRHPAMNNKEHGSYCEVENHE